MAFDAGTIIRAGSAGLFVLLGIFILIVGRKRRSNILLGLFPAVYGLAVLAINLLRTPDTFSLVIRVLVPAAALPISMAIPFVLFGGTTRRERIAIGVALGFTASLMVLFYLLGANVFDVLSGSVGSSGAELATRRIIIVPFLFAVLSIPLTLSARAAVQPSQSRNAMVCMAAVTGAAGFALAFQSPTFVQQPFHPAVFAFSIFFIAALTVDWLVVQARTGSRFALAIALAWPALGALSYLYLLIPGNAGAAFLDLYGVIGILRVVGWSFVVYAILRHDLLGVPLPHIAVNRGAASAGALALLFIVAQIAQNFFSAEYGLLAGGVIAGTFLFAASPVQRLLERRNEKASKTAPSPADLDAFRHVAKRLAADGNLSAADHHALASLADQLGLGAVAVADALAGVEPSTASSRRRR